MRISKRIKHVEKLVPEVKKANDIELELVTEWLAENCEEFRECVRQLFRLKCKTGQKVANWLNWDEQFRVQASIYCNRIEELIEEHKVHVLKNKTTLGV